MFLTHLDIIAAWPSDQTLAADLSQRVETIRAWKMHNRIPPFHYAAVISAAGERGIGLTLDLLATTAPKRGLVGRPKKVAAQ